MRLYRNDREWLKGNSPMPVKSTTITSSRINWNKRDEETLEKVMKVVDNAKVRGKASSDYS